MKQQDVMDKVNKAIMVTKHGDQRHVEVVVDMDYTLKNSVVDALHAQGYEVAFVRKDIMSIAWSK